MMNVKTLWHGGEPKRDISPMSSLLLVKSCKLWDHILKWKESSTLHVFTLIYIVVGWAQRILKCPLASTRIGPKMLSLGVLYP